MVNRLLAALGLLLFSGGVAQAAADFVVTESAPPRHGIQFADERPARDLKGGLPLLFDPTYSVPDKRVSPRLLNLLGAALEASLGDRIKGQVVTIRRLQLQVYFRKTYERNQTINLTIAAGLTGALVAAVDGKQPIDAALFRLSGSVSGRDFEVNLAEPFEPGKVGMGMIYNGTGAREAVRKIAMTGVDAGVAAIAKALEAPAPATP